MKTYLITFYTDKTNNGYAVVNACNPKLAQDILYTQGRELENKYHIVSIEELFAPCDGLKIVNEGITTSGMSAYQIAVRKGFKGTIKEWLESLRGPKGDPGTPGKDGHTPTREVDYWTEEDKLEIILEVIDRIPESQIPEDILELLDDVLVEISKVKINLNNKLNTISDLTDIRTGAQAGSTAYLKPSTGIPKSDLASVVQASLSKADTALQEHQDISGKADKVQNATANNVALLDANGNCIDSGKAFTPQGIGALPSSTDVLFANRVWYSGQPKMKNRCPRNVLCLTYDETYMLPTNTDGSAVTTKTLTDLDFDPFGQILVPPNGVINAESSSIYMLAYHSLGFDLRISFNITSSLTVNRAVYLVMVPQSNGRCKLHTSPISQTLPTTEDGLVYKFLGHAVSANNCCLEFSKPCYYFKDGQIREWTNNSDKQDLLVSGTNIKTINNQSLLGSGNININSTTSLPALKILVLGNSYSYDSFMYMPFILLNYGINIELAINFRGAGTILMHIDEWNAEQPDRAFAYINTGNGDTAWSVTEYYNPKRAVTYTDWDIIVLQLSSTASSDVSNYSATRTLIDLITDAYKEQFPNRTFQLAWNININRKGMGTGTTIENSIINAIKTTCDTQAINIIFPYGTAIFDARTNSILDNIGDGGSLWAQDTVHLQQGLPCYLAALANVLTLFNKFYPLYSVYGDTLRPTDALDTQWNILGMNDNCTGITEANCRLAQICAIVANRYPWEIKTIS